MARRRTGSVVCSGLLKAAVLVSVGAVCSACWVHGRDWHDGHDGHDGHGHDDHGDGHRDDRH